MQNPAMEDQEQQPQQEGTGTLGVLTGSGDAKAVYAPWDDLDQQEQNERNRAAILALADAVANQANVALVRELLASGVA